MSLIAGDHDGGHRTAGRRDLGLRFEQFQQLVRGRIELWISRARAQTLPLKPGENPVGQTLTGKKKGGDADGVFRRRFRAPGPGSRRTTRWITGSMQATERPLFSYMPNTANVETPDLAATMPTMSNGGITDGGKTLTVHIRPGVFFGPPVNRQVTAQDVAFAIERGANPNVGNAYFPAYFGAGAPAPLIGTTSASYKGGPIPGITTPNKTTIVFHMTKPGATLLLAGAEPADIRAAPGVVRGAAGQALPDDLRDQYLIASGGPYMIEADKTGKIAGIGYQPGKSRRWCVTPTGIRRRTSGPPIWTGSTSTSAAMRR